MKLRCAIVEDNPADQESLRAALISYAEGKEVSFAVECFSSPLQFEQKDDGRFDLLFFDIEMPGLNGLELAKKLRERNQDVILFFVTNLAKYAINGYDYNAYSYLLKPLDFGLLSLKLDGALAILQRKRKEEKVTLKNKDGVFVVEIGEILYIEVENHRVVYHTKRGEFVVFSSLKEVIKPLMGKGFSQPSQSYYVNLARIEKIKKDSLIIDGEEIYISRAKKKPFLEDFNRFMAENI